MSLVQLFISWLAEKMSNEYAVQCNNLTKQYREILALNQLNLTVQKGSVFGFLGKNGAGKTTTIKLICGLIRPTEGSVSVLGNDIEQDEMAVKNLIGYLPQSPRFYGWMTPREMLNYIGQLHQMTASRRKQRTEDVLQLVGLEQAAKRRISGFSGGMLQRLGIAQAIYHNPSILLLDEPTSSLDPAGRYEVLELISQLKNEMTIFLSSHILDDVQRICDDIAIIQEGKLILQADIHTLLEKSISNTFRLVVPENESNLLEAFSETLDEASWTDSIVVVKNQLTGIVHEPETAREAILKLCVEYNIYPDKIEWVHPTLEDIFLKVSNHNE
jgi:ABC-2 type transport system ATP-binding protein